MAELVLAPTSVFREGGGANLHSPYVVASDLSGGASATAWTDGSDASYAKCDDNWSGRGNYPLWSTIDPTIDPSWVTAIGVRFRAKSSDVDYFVVQLFGQVSKLLSNPFHGPVAPLQFTAPGTWQDFDYVVSNTEYDTSGWAPLGVQSALTQTMIYCRTFPSSSTGEFGADGVVLVSEQRIVLYYTRPDDTTAPARSFVPHGLSPLRQHPRSDGLGASSTRRLYPLPPSVQASNRRAGGYL